MKLLKKLTWIINLLISPLLIKAQTLTFSGYTWNIKNSQTRKGPGDNFWSADTNNVKVDSKGNLHLKISKNADGNWYCAEIYTQKKFGNGTYQFWVEGKIDRLDKNIVFGIFDYNDMDGADENDIEYSRWGNEHNNNLNYTVYPANKPTANKQTFSKNISLNGTYTTQRFTRKIDKIKFESLHGFYDNDNTKLYAGHSFTNRSFLSKANMPVHINLWLFNSMPPLNGKQEEIIIHAFKYTPDKALLKFRSHK